MKYNKFTIRNYRAIEGYMEINIKKNKLVPLIGTNESEQNNNITSNICI